MIFGFEFPGFLVLCFSDLWGFQVLGFVLCLTGFGICSLLFAVYGKVGMLQVLWVWVYVD